MRLPIKRPISASILSLPDLSGGLNLRDGLSEILDNQLTECQNMWWRNGVLKTRPGIDSKAERIATFDRVEEQTVNIKNFPSVKYLINGESCFLQAAHITVSDSCYLKFYWIGSNKTTDIASISGVPLNTTFFVCIQKDTLYCFTSAQKIYTLELSADKPTWKELTNSDMYVPQVLMQCEKIEGKNATRDQVLASGVMIEGFNILSDYYTISYNSYNPMIVTQENPSHEMRYHLPESVAKAKYEGKTVTAVYKKNGEEYTHTIVLDRHYQSTESNNMWMEMEANPGDHMIMKVWKNNVTFWYDSDTIATVEDGGEDDLVITAPYITSEVDKKKIFGMTQCEWFGGNASGLGGGTRLFLGGNESAPSLVLWSDLNKPLFFPENSYFYVGDSTSKVTGFGKQSDLLVIFKENETWCTSYQQNTNITAEDLIKQNVVDYTASSVYFPLVQINTTIGCTYPDTIQLCRNRLIWFGNGNKVYTLVSESPYNERSIFCVSEMINRMFEPYGAYKKPTSCDWNGYYCLCFGNEIYLMDYNCYGFTHVASYSKTEDANIRIPWFYWVMPADSIIATLNGDIVLTYYHEGNSFQNCGIISNALSEKNGPVDKIVVENGDQEEMMLVGTPILSMLKTKLFDFGAPHVRKNIEQVNLQLGNNGGNEIKVRFITENGSDETELYLSGIDTKSNSAGFIDSRAVFPCIKQTLKFAIQLESQGDLAVDSVILKYRTTGGAR